LRLVETRFSLALISSTMLSFLLLEDSNPLEQDRFVAQQFSSLLAGPFHCCC